MALPSKMQKLINTMAGIVDPFFINGWCTKIDQKKNGRQKYNRLKNRKQVGIGKNNGESINKHGQ